MRDKAAKNKALEHASEIFGDGKLDYPQVGANGDSFVRGRDSLRKHITKLFTSRIAYYDGAMGTMIQKENLQEEDFRGERFKNYDMLIKGNNDLLSITQPDVIKTIYTKYLEAGSDMIGTNTFSSTTIAQADYKMEDLVYELNYVGAHLARDACDAMTAKDKSNPRFVVGAIGLTNRTASISPDVEDPSCRNCTFDELVEAYYEQVGSDILIVETIFDTLNAKAALYAIGEFLEDSGLDIPVFVSGTLVDQSGRTLSGQTGEAFYNSLRHAKPMCVGLNRGAHVIDINVDDGMLDGLAAMQKFIRIAVTEPTLSESTALRWSLWHSMSRVRLPLRQRRFAFASAPTTSWLAPR